jgi:hypothetical protein
MNYYKELSQIQRAEIKRLKRYEDAYRRVAGEAREVMDSLMEFGDTGAGLEYLEFEITKVTVLTGRSGPDKVMIQTTHPTPYPEASSAPLSVMLDVVWRGGREYALDQLKVNPELIEVTDVG